MKFHKFMPATLVRPIGFREDRAQMADQIRFEAAILAKMGIGNEHVSVLPVTMNKTASEYAESQP